MPRSNVANAISTTLASAMTGGSTTIEVASATGFPTVPFYVVIDPYNDSAREFILVGGKAGTTFNTLTRNLTGSQSQIHAIGDIVRSSYVAQTLEDLWDFVEALIQTHASLPDISTDDHHPEQHSIASHSDTSATGAELDELTGAGVTALHSHTGGGGAVDSVFGRTGAVTAALNDYLASLVQNDSSVSGATVMAALNTLLAATVSGNPYFVSNHGGDMRSDIQTAINDAETDGGGEVLLDRGRNIIGASGGTDATGNKYGLLQPDDVTIRGQGCGNGRTHSSGDTFAGTMLVNTATPSKAGIDYYLLSANSGGSPAWEGSRITGVHLTDEAAHCDALLGVSGLNGYIIDFCSFDRNVEAGSYCLKIIESSNNQPTQYGRMIACNVYGYKNGIGIFGNNPDWEFHAVQNQHEGGTNPVAGSAGYYINSNAIRIFGGETQMYEDCISLDGAGGLGKHFKLNTHHFEGHQGAASNAYDSFFKTVNGHASMFPILFMAEYAQSGKYLTPINIGSGTGNTQILFNHVRDSRMITTVGDSMITNNGTGTRVV